MNCRKSQNSVVSVQLIREKFCFTEILTEAEYLSVDPYMRAYMIGYKLPTDMIGGQVAKYSILIVFCNTLCAIGILGSFHFSRQSVF